jgi:hypothetical protein
MVRLFIYDGSILNRRDYSMIESMHYFSLVSFEKDNLLEFKRLLTRLNPPIPFLVRGLHGDWHRNKDDTLMIKNTFHHTSLDILLFRILNNGHDRTKNNGFSDNEAERMKLIRNDWLWARSYSNLTEAIPYREAVDGDTEGRVHDLSLILNQEFYNKFNLGNEKFFQKDVEKRRQALLGIILSDTNPKKSSDTPSPLEYSLTLENLNEILKDIKDKGYFTQS